jgi:hypothetical protein
MKFSAKEDIDAPIGDVFAMLSDFERYERSALRRGAEVRRTSDPSVLGLGMTWDVAFSLRGKRRQMTLEMVSFDAPRQMKIKATSPNLSNEFVVDLVALSPQRTRVAVSLDLSPKNLSARLLVQSLKLAKASLSKQFKLRVAEYSKEIETRFKQAS